MKWLIDILSLIEVFNSSPSWSLRPSAGCQGKVKVGSRALQNISDLASDMHGHPLTTEKQLGSQQQKRIDPSSVDSSNEMPRTRSAVERGDASRQFHFTIQLNEGIYRRQQTAKLEDCTNSSDQCTVNSIGRLDIQALRKADHPSYGTAQETGDLTRSCQLLRLFCGSSWCLLGDADRI